MRMKIPRLADGTEEVDIRIMDDGSGRALTHWLVECDDGPIFIMGHPELRKVAGRPSDGRYRIACRPEQDTINSQKRGSVRFICMTSGEVECVTCPACLATPGAVSALSAVRDSPQVAHAAQFAADTVRAVNAASKAR